MFWWWELLDPMDAYPQYSPLAKFMADVPLDSGLEASGARVTGAEVRVVGLQGRDCAYLWLFNPQATWWKQVVLKQTPSAVVSARLKVPQLAAGTYRVVWWDTDRGTVLAEQEAKLETGSLTVAVPGFSDDLACKVVPRVP
jgi:hypothetical protein